jgi:hypothetical protein
MIIIYINGGIKLCQGEISGRRNIRQLPAPELVEWCWQQDRRLGGGIFKWKFGENYDMKQHCLSFLRFARIVVFVALGEKDFYGRGDSQKGSKGFWEDSRRS